MLPAIGRLFGSLEITDFRCNWCRLQLMAIGPPEYSTFTVVKTIICVWQQKQTGRGRRGQLNLTACWQLCGNSKNFTFLYFHSWLLVSTTSTRNQAKPDHKLVSALKQQLTLWACPHCGKQLSRKISLKAHIANMHSTRIVGSRSFEAARQTVRRGRWRA